jgi:hypothetical protein
MGDLFDAPVAMRKRGFRCFSESLRKAFQAARRVCFSYFMKQKSQCDFRKAYEA